MVNGNFPAWRNGLILFISCVFCTYSTYISLYSVLITFDVLCFVLYVHVPLFRVSFNENLNPCMFYKL